MNKRFSYSILTYKHSQFLGEVLNVGVLFVFPDENLIEFHYPKSLVRLSSAYTDFNTNLIKDYLRSFEEKSKRLNLDLDSYALNDHKIITNHFIIEDASALQFEPFRAALYSDSVDDVYQRYSDLILGHYKSETVKTTSKITEKEIVSSLKSKVYRLNPASRDYLRFDNDRILKSNHVQFKSDFYWRNGVTNYAKAISFFVGNESRIIDKAILINGKLRQLEGSRHKNAHIDLIVQQPIDSKFGDTISEALSILEQNQIQTEIYSDLDAYSREVADHIQPI